MIFGQIYRSSHKLAVQNGTSEMKYFSEAPEGSVQRALYDTKIIGSPVTIQHATEGVTMMANGELPSGTVVVAVHMPLRNLHLCQVTTLDQDLRPVGNGMVFKKGWRYTKVLDYYFKKVPKEQIYIRYFSRKKLLV